MIRRLIPLCAALALASCASTSISYNGEQYQPTARVDVYRSQMEVRGLHRVIGEGRMSVEEGTSTAEIREAFMAEARRRGAQGVIIQDPADRPYGSSGYAPGSDESREVVTVFIRYDDAAAAPPPRDTRYEPAPAPTPGYGSPDQDPYTLPGAVPQIEPYRQY